jgi:ankyrin repeat protein
VLEHRATIEPEAEKRPVPNWKAILNTAAERCTSDTFALLLEHGADLSRADPLHHAAGVPSNHPPGERIPMLEYLGGLGLDVNAIADTNRPIGLRGTPLQYAISQGRIIEAKWLLENGADPDKVAWGRSSRDLVNRNYYAGHEMRTVLRDFDSSMSNLHSAHKH